MLIIFSVIAVVIAILITVYFASDRFRGFLKNRYPKIFRTEQDYTALLTEEDLSEDVLDQAFFDPNE